MMKSASMSVLKWQQKAASASSDFVEGAKNTDKDQAASAIAAKEIYKQALTESFSKDSYAKGLQKSGKAGWQKGIEEKGAVNYATGVGSSSAASAYSVNSGRYDAARQAAKNIPRGIKGDPKNLGKVQAVVSALRAIKVGK